MIACKCLLSLSDCVMAREAVSARPYIHEVWDTRNFELCVETSYDFCLRDEEKLQDCLGHG